ncbi:MAG: hypothetical protein IT174_14175 [Acidobacteria bacterium]|nr:hypothetical protein [Acidobacteriota bacterium]
MKYCPSCLSQYSDLTLKFCLQDGTPLSALPVKQSTIETVAFSQPLTVQNLQPTGEFKDSSIDRRLTSPELCVARLKPRSSGKGLIAGGIIFAILVTVAAGGVAGWVYLSKRPGVARDQKVSISEAEPNTAAGKPEVQTDVSKNLKPDPDANSESSADIETVKKEIAVLIENWKDLIEGRNAEKLSRMYGEKVEYKDKNGVTGAELKAEMQKTFDAYSMIEIVISNLLIAVDAEGDAATALFDKEWSYEASPKLNEGKSHTKLHFRKIGNEWSIVTEKDLKIYYIED